MITFKAKFCGTCAICGKNILVGEDMTKLPAPRLVNAPNPYYGEIHGGYTLTHSQTIVKKSQWAHVKCAEGEK
jgi:hypothetical protein